MRKFLAFAAVAAVSALWASEVRVIPEHKAAHHGGRQGAPDYAGSWLDSLGGVAGCDGVGEEESEEDL